MDVAVISDIHVMAPQLLCQDGTAYRNYIAHDRKMLTESPRLLENAVSRILQDPPEAVFVTGDLTKDGERLSHRLVAEELLRPLLDKGIKVFVIPGNHDVNNPHAVSFHGDSTVRTETVSAGEFVDIYSAYGYGDAIARDSCSLSYVARLNDSVRVLAVDACRYYDNDFDANICVTGGRILPGTMKFIKEQALKAREDGCRMVTIMHHGLVRHWKWQDRAMPEYLVEDWKKNARIFGKYGLNIVFTGHFHAQDIASSGSGKRKVYDIETGSTVSCPLPLRRVTLEGSILRTTTSCLVDKGTDSLWNKSLRYAREGISTIVSGIVPDNIPAEVVGQASEVVSEAYLAHVRGDESMPEGFAERLQAAVARLRPYSFKYSFILDRLTRYLCDDDGINDNDAVLIVGK